MNAADPRSLIAGVETEHRLIEQQLRCLREVAESILDSDAEQCEEYLDALHRVDHFFRTDVLPHFTDEEEGLFVELREHLDDGPRRVVDLVKDHDLLREQFESFGGQLAALRYADAEGRGSFLCDLTRTCWDIWHLLHDHTGREVRAISDYLIKHLNQHIARSRQPAENGPAARTPAARQ